MATIYIVVQQWPGGARNMVSAWLSEDAARLEASKWVGKDGALINLETVGLEDLQTQGLRAVG